MALGGAPAVHCRYASPAVKPPDEVSAWRRVCRGGGRAAGRVALRPPWKGSPTPPSETVRAGYDFGCPGEVRLLGAVGEDDGKV